MLRKRWLILLSTLFIVAAGVQTQDSVSSLIESELAFARLASEKGIKDAFLAFLADDSVLFRPRTVQGKQWMAGQPPTPGLLKWEPSYAEVSGARDLGFTTGPFTYAASSEEAPSSYGQFFSVWKKQSDQAWKVVLDAGINHDKLDAKVSVTSRTGKGKVVSIETQNSEQQSLIKVDQELSQSYSSKFFAKDVIILRNQALPRRGLESAKPLSTDPCTFTREKLEIAASTDLAYTFGSFKCPTFAGVYVRVWRNEDNWRVALDYSRPDP
ncbi:nuclear transport factor 2 family protein [bacterium]|nr:nuclear transport factor 2 family protein [bacterium]